jgi:putative addiction module component (TIGR02574 family)
MSPARQPHGRLVAFGINPDLALITRASTISNMPSQTVSSLLRLPRRRRLEIAERLWLSVADEKEMPVPESHKKILDARLAAYRSGKSKPISHEELMRRLRTP